MNKIDQKDINNAAWAACDTFRGVVDPAQYKDYILVMLLLASLTGFCLTGDLFNQFVWLEILSVSAFALTAFLFEDRRAVEAGFKYLITNSIAAMFIVVALALLYMQTGALNLAQIARDFEPSTAGLVAVGLLVSGYATKAALVPWHFWLPDAHAVSPAPVSGLFSGALIKIGMYALGRTIFTLAPLPPGGPAQGILLAIAGMTMLIGSVQMVQQRLIKRILAYSSVSQMGYILMGLAVGTPLGVAAAAMHAINHALVKTTLFLGAGIVGWRADVHTVDEGGGLAPRMPVTLTLMILAGLGLSGIPLFSGFISKMMLEEAAHTVHADWIVVIAVASSAFTFAGIARLIWRVFAPDGSAPKRTEVHEAPVIALLPLVALVALAVLIGIAPTWIVRGVAWPAAALNQPQTYIHTVLEIEPVSPATVPHFEAPPSPFDPGHWLVPLIILVGGSLLTYLTLKPGMAPDRAWLRPIRAGATAIKRWHSGLVSDYALWNAFGTMLLLAVLLIASQWL